MSCSSWGSTQTSVVFVREPGKATRAAWQRTRTSPQGRPGPGPLSQAGRSPPTDAKITGCRRPLALGQVLGPVTRDGGPTALPPLETLPTTAEFYDYTVKRDPNGHCYHCPAVLPPPLAAAVQQAALDAHRALGCHGHSRSDFLVTKTGEVYWLEVNTLPGLSAHGNLATMANAAGISYDQLVGLILTAAHRAGYRP
ncbi:D-alanine--D-alanine ligase family protein [Kitasatospora griseola]|uniref:hypothetical protein n=1 Tax=Kitasatospora griseola TaxID=2064 RepID=UPI00381E788B